MSSGESIALREHGMEHRRQSEMLEVRNVSKTFGAIHAVRGVSFRVEKGEILGLG